MDLWKKLPKKDLFLYSKNEDAVVRTVRYDDHIDYYIKFKGMHEFQTSKDSDALCEIILEKSTKEITEQEYKEFK